MKTFIATIQYSNRFEPVTAEKKAVHSKEELVKFLNDWGLSDESVNEDWEYDGASYFLKEVRFNYRGKR